jgi:hypothetical protein
MISGWEGTCSGSGHQSARHSYPMTAKRPRKSSITPISRCIAPRAKINLRSYSLNQMRPIGSKYQLTKLDGGLIAGPAARVQTSEANPTNRVRLLCRPPTPRFRSSQIPFSLGPSVPHPQDRLIVHPRPSVRHSFEPDAAGAPARPPRQARARLRQLAPRAEARASPRHPRRAHPRSRRAAP